MRRCYLGGSDPLNGGFLATDPNGAWLARDGDRHPALAGRPDAGYLSTGHFAKGQYFHIDPANFSVAAYYDRLTAG
jgi:hypothetical protein